MSDVIGSAANPLARRVRALADRRHRRREGAFVVEGVQPVWRAVEAAWDVEVLLVCEPMLRGSPAAAMVAEREAGGTRVARLTPDLFTRLSTREGPPGLAAIVRTRQLDARALPGGPGSVTAVLHRVGNPGNLGTVVRTVDAVGASGVLLVGDCADPFAPAAVKASMGSLFSVGVAHLPDDEAFLEWARERGVQIVATSGYADADHWSASYRSPTAVLLGSEGDGLPDHLLRAADMRVRIPMTGTAESLNLAVAAGIMLYEVRRLAVP